MGNEAVSRQALIEYMQSACKGGDMGAIGVKMGHFIMDEDGETVPYAGCNGRTGLEDILEKLAEFYPQVTRTEEGRIMACARPAVGISLQAGGQVVVSIAPLLSVAQIEDEYERFRFRLKQIIAPLGFTCEACGYNPHEAADDIALVPNPAFAAAEEQLAAIPGVEPRRLLRACANLEVSVDFADEADAVLKLRIATLLAPVLSFLADNSPVFEGVGNPGALCRLNVMKAVDPARCGAVPGLFSPDFGFGAYADWALAAGPVPAGAEGIEALLGSMWPHARLGKLVELCAADALPVKPAMGYIALLKGLFYGPASLELLEHLLKLDQAVLPYDDSTVPDAIEAITAQGYTAVVYGRSVNEWVDLLLSIAPEGLGTEFEYLEELKEFKGL